MTMINRDNSEEFRQWYWEKVLEKIVFERILEKKNKRCFEYIERLYHGEKIDPNEKSIQSFLSKRPGSIQILFLMMRDQNKLAWESFFDSVAPKWGYDSYDKKKNKFAYCLGNLPNCPMDYGWQGAADLSYFHFWCGEQYNPDGYEFMGKNTSMPLSPAGFVKEIAVGMSQALTGFKHHQSKYLHLYDYWKSALTHIDSDVFYSRSTFSEKCFTDVDKDEIVSAKYYLSRILQTIHFPEKGLGEFREMANEKPDKSDIRLPSVPFDMKELSDEEFWNLSSLVELRQSFMDDLNNEVFPDSILELNEWAKHPEAEPNDLDRATREKDTLKDPYNPGLQRKKRATVKKMRSENSKLLDVIPLELCTALETTRQKLLEIGVSTAQDQPIDKEQVVSLLKAQKYTGKHAIYQIEQLSNGATVYDHFELLIPKLYFRIEREPFAAYEDSDINAVYKDAWKLVGEAIERHSKLESIRTRKKKLDDGVFDVTVTAAIGGEKLSYEYGVSDPGIDEALLNDIAELPRVASLPWEFHFDENYSEGEVLVFYLPTLGKKMLLS